jgi:hypothetical protein
MPLAIRYLLPMLLTIAPAYAASVPAGVDPAQVLAVYPLPRDARPEQVILLQGVVKDGRFEISEHTLPASTPAPEAPGPMPLGVNLLAGIGMTARTFGVEERASATLQDGRLRIACRPGPRPAGVLLQGPWYLPRADVVLQAAFSGAGRFTWRVADARLAAREGAVDLGDVAATAKLNHARLALPPNLDRASWRQFTVLCPQEGGTLALDALTLEPTAAPSNRPPRSTWVWDRSEWRERGDALIDWAAAQGLGEVFVTVPLLDARVAEPEALAAFVRRAGARGVAVTAVEGDPHMVLPDQHAPSSARARAYAAYNAGAEPAARLKGMQFDVEPYLLPATVLDPAQRDRRFLELAAALRQASGSMPLEFVVPFWWDSKRELLRELARHADGLAVMDYRTDPGQIQRFAAPFLDWGVEHRKRVRIALEAGPIAAEEQLRYRRVEAGAKGDLLLTEHEGQQVLVLLRAPGVVSQGRMYALGGSRIIDGSATTFHRDKAAMMRLLPQLENVFGAWKSFNGMALHELR